MLKGKIYDFEREGDVLRRLIFLMAIFYLIQTYASNPGLASLPVVTYLKETLGLSAAQLASFQLIAFLPWVVKPIFGIITDGFLLFGYQLKSYFVLCYALVFAFFLGLSTVQSYTLPILTVAAVSISAGIAFSDVLADKLMVIEGKARRNTAALQATQWAAFGLGGAGMYSLSGWLAQNSDLSFTFLLSSAMPLMGIVSVFFFLKEKRELTRKHRIRIRNKIGILLSTMQSREFLAIASFIAFLGFSPTPPIFYYQRDVLHFAQDLIGVLGAFRFLGMGLGAIAFGLVAKKISRQVLLNCIIGFSAISTLSLIFMSDAKSAIWVYIFLGFTDIIATLGILELAALTCPVGVEGVIYTGVISISNLAMGLGYIFGGWLYDRGIVFPVLVAVYAIFTALCWFLIPLLKLERIQ